MHFNLLKDRISANVDVNEHNIQMLMLNSTILAT